ncbi:PAS domain-containing protein [Oscillatoria sp. CS-180]|uniref:PAS domain-containing protein n=1 Tax=Oscillatoria sp. CS-180 TaxID=3021720 RepID=UPI00232C09CB|nr:PAS domain-containing protein [Oscillatoria sp. CS-180]MDB9526882.1 PAS domain-containing protein [Oscillatoria sp. CS-180]
MTRLDRTILVIGSAQTLTESYERFLQQDSTISYRLVEVQRHSLSLAERRFHEVNVVLIEAFSKQDSLDLLAQIKVYWKAIRPPIIVIGDEDIQTAVAVIKAGAADYLVKDQLTPDSLCNALRTAVTSTELQFDHLSNPELSVLPAGNEGNCCGVFSAIRDDAGEIVDFRIDYLSSPTDGNGALPQRQSLEPFSTVEENRLLETYCQSKQAETALKSDEKNLRRVLDSLQSFVGVLTPDGILIEVNQMALVSASLQPIEVLSQPFEQTYWWSYDASVQQLLRTAIQRAASGDKVRYDARIRLGPDRFITIDFALVPLFDADGQVEYLIPSGVDITERIQAEASLQENQVKLRQQLAELEAIYQTAPIGLAVFDRDLRFVRINQRLAEMNGPSAEAHLGYTIRELLPDLADEAEQFLFPILQNGEPLLNVEIEGETPASPGVKRIWRENFVPLKDGNQIIGISTVCEEVTDIKRTELALKEAHIQLEAALLAGAISTWRWDIVHNLVTTDSSCADLFGVDPNQAKTGLPIEKFLDAMHPDDRPQVEADISRAIVTRGNYSTEFRVHNARGEERWVLARGRAEYDLAGKAIAFPGALTDLTDRKRVETALSQSEERYRTLFESMEDGFCVIEVLFDDDNQPVDYLFLEVNPAFERQTGLQQAAGKTARQLVPNLESHWPEIYGRIVATGEPMRFENAAEAIDRWFEVHAFPIAAPEDHRVAVLFKEISARKQIEAEREKSLQRELAAREDAERANRIKDEFLAILSHELRSPLNPILGWASLLQTNRLSAEKTAQALETIERNAKLQSQLIDDLLDVARILRGKLKLETVPVDPISVIEAALETVKSAAKAKEIEIHLDLSDVGQIQGDMARLQQVVWNLLSNAIKFTPNNGRIEVKLVRKRKQAHIIVSDTGIGIPPDFLPHIFESFRQEDTSITRQFGGLGLGLAIVRYLVEAHGGNIKAASLGEGHGATFTVSLPLLKDSSTAQLPSRLSQEQVDLSHVQVVAVDDSPDSLEMTKVILSQYGAEVIVFTSAKAALSALETFIPDILISDIGMPDMDGYALIRQLRSRSPEQGGTIPAIALTAYARQEDYQHALDSGFQKHITKPVQPETLAIAVAELVLPKANR